MTLQSAKTLILTLLFFTLVLIRPSMSYAESSPEGSVAFWKPFEVQKSDDQKVKTAHDVFQRLLLGWEHFRIAPRLLVIQKGRGPMAAALPDGTILLTREAIALCWQGAPQFRRDRLAFVLAHELAHQRSSHLWHRIFFQLPEQKPLDAKRKILGNMSIAQMEKVGVNLKEVQADRDGIILMAMVGFDPQGVIEQGDFFLKWVASLHGKPCGDETPDHADCDKAKERVSRIQAHLSDAAKQATLFQLGVQSYVSGHYKKARRFFTAYGQEFPGPEVHKNIGLTYLGEAINLRKQLLERREDLGPEFVYSLILEEAPRLQNKEKDILRGTPGRGRSNAFLRKEMQDFLHQAILSFQRAIEMGPEDRSAYWNLIASHLLAGNGPLAYGLTAGTYVKRFTQDATATLFLAISAALEGQNQQAESLFVQSIRESDESLIVMARINRAVFLSRRGDKKGEEAEWKKLAALGLKRGDEALFQLARHRIKNRNRPKPSSKILPEETIAGYGLGQYFDPGRSECVPPKCELIRFEGIQLQVHFLSEGSRILINADQKIIALWQKRGNKRTLSRLKIGDDIQKVKRKYGLATRKIRTLRGYYWTYDQHHIAFRFVEDKIVGWFLYAS